MYAQSFLLEFFKGVPFMTNEEIYDVSGGSDEFDLSNIKESEKLVHLVMLGGEGFNRTKNPNGSEFFMGTFLSDSEACNAIHSLERAILDCASCEIINELCVKLDKCLPIIDGIKYVMDLNEAFYLSKTDRPMNDIYFYDGNFTDNVILKEYISGRYAS